MAKKIAKKNTEETVTRKSVVVSPRITEKSALSADARGVYTFNVTHDATKKGVMNSVKAAYKVTPVKVRLLAVPEKKVFRGKWGVKRGGKKAYVYLKKGDKIEFA